MFNPNYYVFLNAAMEAFSREACVIYFFRYFQSSNIFRYSLKPRSKNGKHLYDEFLRSPNLPLEIVAVH
jgi:hypothetical protein